MKKTRRILSLVFALVILATSVCSASANGIPSVISDYFTCLDEQNWSALGALLADEDQAEFEAFIANSDNREGHIGYFNFESVSLVSCQSVATDEIDNSIVDEEKLSKYTNLECWDCIAEVVAHEDSNYLTTGYNHYIIYTAKDSDGDSRIIQVVRDKTYVLSDDSVSVCSYDTPVSPTYGSEWDNPATINVLYNGEIVTLGFREYCEVVLMGEFGTNSFNEEARKAVAMSVKQYGWNRTLVQKYSNTEYDVKSTTADQYYNPANEPTEKVIAAVDAIWGYMMLTSSNKHFCGFHCANSSINSYARENGGILSQDGADSLGDDGYTWMEILHYYYDNGAYIENSENVDIGIIKIMLINHSISGIVRLVPNNVHSHNVVCFNCGGTHAVAHTWTASGSNYMCTSCNYVTDLAPSAPLKCEE